MGKRPPGHYWSVHNQEYPFQIEVPHMSAYDVDPRKVQKEVTFNFLRVPFDGMAHWGFKSQENLDAFKKFAGID